MRKYHDYVTRLRRTIDKTGSLTYAKIAQAQNYEFQTPSPPLPDKMYEELSELFIEASKVSFDKNLLNVS